MPPGPAGGVDDRAPQDRTSRDPESGGPTPQSDGDTTSFGWQGLADQRETKGHDRGSPAALDGSGGDEQPDVGGERGQRRAESEQPDAAAEDGAPPETITERGRGQKARGERQGVGVDRPFQAFEVRVQPGSTGGEGVVTMRASSATMNCPTAARTTVQD
jgi:hypothetical protein